MNHAFSLFPKDIFTLLYLILKSQLLEVVMSISVFLELVEIKAKTASVFPFLLGTLFAWYHYHTLHIPELLVFFVAMLLFNMAVDANDNYQDYRRSEKTEALHFREKTNIIGVNHLNPSMIGWMVVAMMVTSAVLGLWMVSRTGWPLLVMGLFSFAVGYGYAGGPRPIPPHRMGNSSRDLRWGLSFF